MKKLSFILFVFLFFSYHKNDAAFLNGVNELDLKNNIPLSYKADVNTLLPVTIKTKVAQHIKADTSGVFHLQFDPGLYNIESQPLLLFLLDDKKSAGLIIYSDNQLYFTGSDNYSFSFKIKNSSLKYDLLSQFFVEIKGIFTLNDTAVSTIVMKNGTFILKNIDSNELTVETDGTCTLEGVSNHKKVQIKANQLHHKGELKCHMAFFEILEGSDASQSRIQAEKSISIKGFKTFDHYGQFCAKESVVTQGDTYNGQKGSFIFAGGIHAAEGKDYIDQGRVIAWHSQIDISHKATLGSDYWFLGYYLALKAAWDVDIQQGSLLTPARGIHINSENLLRYEGSTFIQPSHTTCFPYWDYEFGPSPLQPLSAAEQHLLSQRSKKAIIPPEAKTKTFASTLKQIKTDIERYRRETFANVKLEPGILLEAKGNFVNRGTLHTNFGSIKQSGHTFYFDGSSQSGFCEGDVSLTKAVKAICDGIFNAPQAAYFYMDQSLFLGGYTNSPLIHTDASNINLSGHLKGSVTVKGADKIVSSAVIEGSFLNIFSKLFNLTAEGINRLSDFIFVESDGVLLEGQMETKRIHVEAPDLKIAETATLDSTDKTTLTATHLFENKGTVESQGDVDLTVGEDSYLGYIMARKWFNFYSPNVINADEFFSQTDPIFTRHGGLKLITDHPQLLTRRFDVSYGLGLVAPAITVMQPLSSQKTIHLESVVGSLLVNNSLAGENVTLVSAADLSHYNIGVSENVQLQAQGVYTNTGAVQAEQGTIHAQASLISNSLESSSLKANIIYLMALQTDILNYGTIEALTYLEARAERDILNLAVAHRSGTPYFHRARMVGETGLAYRDATDEERYIGLYLRAENKIHNYVSDLLSKGDIFLSGRRGILHEGDTITYIAQQYTTKSGWFGWKKETHTIWKTVVGQPDLISSQGRIIQDAHEGGLDYIGANVYAPHGDYAHVRDDIRYWNLLTNDRHEVSGSSWWGLKSYSGYEAHQGAVVTKIINGETIDHESFLKGIHGRGVVIQAPIYRGRAKEKIIFDGIKLHHHIHHESNSLLPTFCGSETIMATCEGGDIGSALLQENPLLSKIKSFDVDASAPQKVSAGLKGAAQAYNTAQAFSKASEGGQMAALCFQRYGNVGIRAEQNAFTHHYTTTIPSRLNVDILDLKSNTGVELNDGTQAHIQSLFRVRVPSLRLGHAVDESHTSIDHQAAEVGVNLITKNPYASYDTHSTKLYTKSHQYALINVWGQEGLIDLGDLDLLDLDGAIMFTARIKGTVKKANVTSYQDESTTQQDGFGFSGSKSGPDWKGSIHFSHQESASRTTHNHSGIFVSQELDDDLIIEDLHVTDTGLNTPLQKKAKHTSFHPLTDKSTRSGYGVTIAVDLSSPDAFVKDLTKSVVVGTMGLLTAELLEKANLSDGWASLAGSVAGSVAGMAFDSMQPPETKKETPEFEDTTDTIELRGSISYNKDNHEISLDFFDMAPPSSFKEMWQDNRAEVKENIYQQAIEDNLSQEESEAAANQIDDIAAIIEQTEQDLKEAASKAKLKSKSKIKTKSTSQDEEETFSYQGDPFADLNDSHPAFAVAEDIMIDNAYKIEQKRILDAVSAKLKDTISNAYVQEYAEAMFHDLQEYAEAVFDVYQEIKADILENPLTYGAMAAEYAPGGLGFAASVANQGYHVVSGQSSIGKAAQDLSVDAIAGIIGYKAVKGLGKAGKFVSGKFAAKLAEKRAAKFTNVDEAFGKQTQIFKKTEKAKETIKQAINTNKPSHPKSVAQKESHKRDLREKMGKPHAEDPKLKDLLKKYHRKEKDCVGSGSTAAAARHEIRTGEKVGGVEHTQKAQEGIKELQKWLSKNSTAKPGDIAAAENMLLDLKDALSNLKGEL